MDLNLLEGTGTHLYHLYVGIDNGAEQIKNWTNIAFLTDSQPGKLQFSSYNFSLEIQYKFIQKQVLWIPIRFPDLRTIVGIDKNSIS